MGETYEITDLMIKDHKEIIDCLNRIKHSTGEGSNLVSELFDKLKWVLEKHIFVEEKAIFTFFNPKIKEDYREIPCILEEHNLILDMLSKLDKQLTDTGNIDISEFKRVLEKHKNFEENSLYPKLDRNLDKSQKDIIIKRIREITCKE
ncbi:MAG: hemerythrin domain-containing protein [Candidatus Woesearchaeota archaeon]|nr:MAG: hemerythrin domain-containing protein [Candidatus Woesearchaeota archaeon]